MDLGKLTQDWKTDPALAELDEEQFPNVEAVADRLRQVHQYLTDPARGGPLAYLYRKQIERNRELQKELNDERRHHQQRPRR